jgi:hypothetical protein
MDGGALHSNLRPVRLAMLRERGCPVGRSGREERKQPSSCQPDPVEPGATSWSGRFLLGFCVMRRVRIVEKLNETYSYAAVDQQTGEVPLRLSDRDALVALCQRLGWAVEEKSKSARETKPADLRQRTGERHRIHRGRARPRVGGVTKLISPRKRQERSHVGD